MSGRPLLGVCMIVRDVRRAVADAPDDACLRFQLGRTLWRMGAQPDEALSFFCELSGDAARARSHYEAALRARPDFAPSRERLAALDPSP